jgi:Subtilase family
MRALPILGVQLPPAALRDTSGRRLEGYVVQGMRWLIARNLRQAAGGQVGSMVVNLSLGSLAGPGDETAFLADWLAYEIARYARLIPLSVLRIVAAYGNARRGRLVARAELRAARDLALDWRILPDDHTPSFLEMRTATQSARSLRLSLQSPNLADGVLDIPWPEHGQSWVLGNPARAMVTGVAEDGRRMVQISTAPTAGATTLSPPGRWHIRITSIDESPALISVRVQRDDTPAGYRTLGRQSWLDHPLAWDWDDETRDWTGPQVGETSATCPITREGTAVAYAGVNAAEVFFVGAVRPRPGRQSSTHPSIYTGSGVTTLRPLGESTGPTLAALGDEGMFLSGRRASGVLSGSTARLSGTSVAAPEVTRALALMLDRTKGASTPEVELRALLGDAPFRERHPLTGFGILDPAAAPDLIA